jgi:hypothetical protein
MVDDADRPPGRAPRLLDALERIAVAGLVAGLGCLAVDAALHYRTHIYWYIPRVRLGRSHWALLVRLWHRRPALTLGLFLLCTALLLALGVMVAALARSVRARQAQRPSTERANPETPAR